MIVALAAVVPLIILTLLIRLSRSLWQARHGPDLAGILLALACRHLPADRADWGTAMRTELACIDNPPARRRFATGAAWATVTVRLMRRRHPQPGVVLILAAVIAGAALTATTLISDPGLRRLPHLAPVLTVLATTLIGYPALQAALTDTGTAGATRRPPWSMVVGGVLGFAWILFTTAWWTLHGAPLAVAVLLPMIAAAITTRRTGSIRAGVILASRAGLIGGIFVFLAAAVDALVTAPGANTATRTAAVGESIAIAAMMLILIPGVTLIAATAGAGISRAVGRRFDA